MVDIISAKEAFNESKYRKRANEILTAIIIKIKETCEQGRFEVTVCIDSRTEQGAIDLVLNELTVLGYNAKFKKDTTAACEHYWDKLFISWILVI